MALLVLISNFEDGNNELNAFYVIRSQNKQAFKENKTNQISNLRSNNGQNGN